MTSLAERIARPEILGLPPVDIAANQAGAAIGMSIKLDANENPYSSLVAWAGGINRYPEPQPAKLRAVIAALYGVEVSQLLVTRGSDDAIDLLCRTFCSPGVDSISVCQPTFSAYAQFSLIQGARVIETRLDENFDFSADSFLKQLGGEKSLKLAFLCTPNNPTGNSIPAREIFRVAEALPNTLIVVDEAYIEFSDEPSMTREIGTRENLVVLRTLSKAYGLAGARVGALIAEQSIIDLCARATHPYPLPSLSIDAALTALDPSRRPLHQERIGRMIADRDRLAAIIAEAPWVKNMRTGANFFFCEVDDPAELAETLRAAGVRVRFRPNAAPGGVRVSVGTDSENQALLAALGLAEADQGSRRGEVVRDTKETRIGVVVDLDRAEPRRIATGVPFYDHMLDQVAAHGGFSLILACEGDLEIDAHHSVEDIAIAFGQALNKALGDKRGIGRFGFALPMDEAEAQVLIDVSGRPYCQFDGEFSASHIGDYPTEMTAHVFRSIADSLGAAIHVRVTGDNDHHKTEACYKAFGRALRTAIARDGSAALPSTKGVL